MVGCQCCTYVRLVDTPVATAQVVALADKKFKQPCGATIPATPLATLRSQPPEADMGGRHASERAAQRSKNGLNRTKNPFSTLVHGRNILQNVQRYGL